ncbi:MAG: helix-turn-helix domain-containing protein [Gammaproteobacteria bacterium]
MNNVLSFPPAIGATQPGALTSCTNCRSSNACLVRSLDPSMRMDVAKHVLTSVPIKRGEHLFRQGETMNGLYMLRAGSVKSYLDSADGCEQVAAFHFPGDILGFDALAERRHMSSAIALETVAFCTIPYDRVMSLAAVVPGFWSALMRGAAHRIVDAEQHALMLGQKSAPARLAAFLLNLSQRFSARGCSRNEFNLSMSRQDIANYLAVAVETISRLFTELQRQGAIQVDRRFIRIRSREALEEMAFEGQSLGVSHA